MRIRTFENELWLPLPPEELFPFFGDPNNLEQITPPWLHFHIMTPKPIRMEAGTLIDYKLRVRGVPLKWRTRINEWEPPYRFVDEQIKGPYRQWIHTHTFEKDASGTLIKDHVQYAVPFDALSHNWLVRPDIETIFNFRSTSLNRILNPDNRQKD